MDISNDVIVTDGGTKSEQRVFDSIQLVYTPNHIWSMYALIN